MAPPAQSGMASGANSTARQLGIAIGIAALGAIFQHKILVSLESALAATPTARHATQLAHAVAAGNIRSALATQPPDARAGILHATHQAFVSGFNEIVLVALAVAIAGAISGYALVRTRDLLASARVQPTESRIDTVVAGSLVADARG